MAEDFFSTRRFATWLAEREFRRLHCEAVNYHHWTTDATPPGTKRCRMCSRWEAMY